MHKGDSDFNLRSINTQEYKQIIESTIEYGGNCFVVGRRGSGKTSIIEEVLAEKKYDKFFWNISTLERVDAAGFPDVAASRSKKDEYIRYLLPIIFKPLLEGDRPVVAVLDEVDKAEKELYAPLLEFLQLHSINGLKFKNLKAVLMTGNLPSEGGKRPIPPLLDRTEKYLLEATAKQFLEWGASTGKIHPSVLAYLTEFPNDLCGKVNPGENYADASPRMWESVSNIAKYGESRGWSQSMMAMKASGCIGKLVGIRYQSYLEHYHVLIPEIQKVWDGGVGEYFLSDRVEPGKKITAVIILCTRVATALDNLGDFKKTNDTQSIISVGKFLNVIDEELALIGLRNGIGKERVFKHLFKIKEYDDLTTKLAKQITRESKI